MGRRIRMQAEELGHDLHSSAARLTVAAAVGLSSPASASAATVHVFFVRAEHGVAVHRIAPARTPASAAVRALLLGPTAAERRRGFNSAVPAGSRLLGLAVKRGLATVDLSNRFASGRGSASMNARLAQLVYTLTAVAGVERVDRARSDQADCAALPPAET